MAKKEQQVKNSNSQRTSANELSDKDKVLTPRHIRLLIFPGFYYAVIAMHHSLPTYHGYTPPFKCANSNETDVCAIRHNQTLCPGGIVFEAQNGERTVVMDFELVCDMQVHRALLGTIYVCGVTFGVLTCGILADFWGRRMVFIGCLFSQALLGIALCFTNSLPLYYVLRFGQGFFVEGMHAVYTLLVEQFPANGRPTLALAMQLYWSVGIGVMAGLDYIIPQWQYSILVHSATALVALPLLRYIPESERWLAQKRLQKEEQQQERDVLNEPENKTEAPPVNKKTLLLDLIIRKGLRLRTLVMVTMWFCILLSYFASLYAIPALSGDRHVNSLYGALVEVPVLILGFFLIHRLGRRPPVIISSVISALFFAGAVVVILATNAEWAGTAKVVFIVLGKAFSLAAYFCLALFTYELFPTILRSAGMGLCGFWGRVGNLLAPLLILLGDSTSSALPMAVMTGLSLLAAAICFYLPETRGKPMPNTIQEAIMLKEKSRE